MFDEKLERRCKFLIIVKPLAALLPQPSRIHHLPQQHRRSILPIPHLPMQHLHNRQTRIQPHEIRQLQRSHGHIRPVLHDPIDILFLPHARLETDDRFVDVGHEYPVC